MLPAGPPAQAAVPDQRWPCVPSWTWMSPEPLRCPCWPATCPGRGSEAACWVPCPWAAVSPHGWQPPRRPSPCFPNLDTLGGVVAWSPRETGTGGALPVSRVEAHPLKSRQGSSRALDRALDRALLLGALPPSLCRGLCHHCCLGRHAACTGAPPAPSVRLGGFGLSQCVPQPPLSAPVPWGQEGPWQTPRGPEQLAAVLTCMQGPFIPAPALEWGVGAGPVLHRRLFSFFGARARNGSMAGGSSWPGPGRVHVRTPCPRPRGCLITMR